MVSIEKPHQRYQEKKHGKKTACPQLPIHLGETWFELLAFYYTYETDYNFSHSPTICQRHNIFIKSIILLVHEEKFNYIRDKSNVTMRGQNQKKINRQQEETNNYQCKCYL